MTTATTTAPSTAPAGSTPAPAALTPISWKAPGSGVLAGLATLALLLSSHGSTRFRLATSNDFFQLPVLTVPARPVITLLLVVEVLVAAWWFRLAVRRRRVPTWTTVVLGLAFILAFLTWAGAGRSTLIPLVTILSGALSLSVPLVFGGLAGVIGERSGTVNIAIEGQLLGGAFVGAVAASLAGSSWVGLVAAPLAGILVALLLAAFGLKYRVDQIVVGVVLNVLVLGLTSYLYSTVLADDSSHWNAGLRLPVIAVPVLAEIPIIGPVLFKQTILVYLMYAVVILLQVMLFRSRWGLRMRACGEHPKAADTVGINVFRTRVNNLVLGGALAGLGGAFFTIGSGLSFTKDMAAGNGYIALAAMILGAWRPFGTLGAALLFGFATSLGQTLSVVGSPIPSNVILMIPYIVTVFAVAGYVGNVRAPAAEGVPYP